MKKLLILPALLLLPGLAGAANLLLLSVSGSYLKPADLGYRTFYGKYAIYPEYGVGLRLYKGLYALGSYGKLRKKALTPVLGYEARSSQSYFSGGLGYILKITKAFRWEAEAGLTAMAYREEALDAVVTGRTPGLRAESGFLFMGERGQIFFGVKAGILSARVKDLNIKLGGFRVMVCLGLQLFGE